MKFEQLAGLIKAGFNEEQIRNIGSIMDTGTNTGTGTNTPTPTPTPTTTALQTPTVTPAPTDKPGGTLPSADQSATPPAEKGPESGTINQNPETETVTLLKEMLGLIRKGNISGMGGGALDQPTGADVLAEILNPTPKK